MFTWLLIAVLVAAVLLLWRYATSSNSRLPAAGTVAPAFALKDQHGTTRSLDEFRGRWLALYFYPRDDTPGCTEQAARFRDGVHEIEQLGAAICGISVDSSESHAAFARKHKLPFTLLADQDGETARRYGSLINLGFLKFARRNTFLIDRKGNVAKVYAAASPAHNASEVAADLRSVAT
jgi:peroxiredoxin Q/BCP